MVLVSGVGTVSVGILASYGENSGVKLRGVPPMWRWAEREMLRQTRKNENSERCIYWHLISIGK
jgi:hypothetical protein